MMMIAAIEAAGWAAGLAGVGMGLCVLGAGIGIGYIGGNATQATARQPEASGQVFLQMLIAAALIEGVAFFGIIFSGVAGNGAVDTDRALQEAAAAETALAPAEGQTEFVIEEDDVQ